VPFFLGTLVGLAYLTLKTDAPTWALAACSGITVVLLLVNALFLGVCFADNWLDRIICAIINHLDRLFHINLDKELCRSIVRQFHQSMQMLTTHKKTLFISTFWAVAGWLCMTLVASVTFRSMGVKVPLEAVFAVYAVMIFLQMLPLFLPGGVGLVDIVMITLFNAIGVPMHQAIAATILIRVIQLWFLTALGGIATAYLVRKINKDPSKRGLAENVAKSF
jgi:glycosyltransferase 2 family protein